MDSQMTKIIKIARKMGGRVIVTDPEGNEPFVLMDLASYEEIMNNENKNLTGNPEGVIIKPEITQNFAGIPLEDQAFNSDSFAEISEEDVIEDERFYLEPIE